MIHVLPVTVKHGFSQPELCWFRTSAKRQCWGRRRSRVPDAECSSDNFSTFPSSVHKFSSLFLTVFSTYHSSPFLIPVGDLSIKPYIFLNIFLSARRLTVFFSTVFIPFNFHSLFFSSVFFLLYFTFPLFPHTLDVFDFPCSWSSSTFLYHISSKKLQRFFCKRCQFRSMPTNNKPFRIEYNITLNFFIENHFPKMLTCAESKCLISWSNGKKRNSGN